MNILCTFYVFMYGYVTSIKASQAREKQKQKEKLEER